MTRPSRSTPTRPGRSWRSLAAAPLLLTVLAACGGDVPGEGDPHAAHDSAAPPPPSPEPHAGHDMADMGEGDGSVLIPPAVARSLGVTFAEARREDLFRTLRAPGEVLPDETRLTTVSLRFAGWAEALHVDHTGQAVRAGEPLLSVYSPEVVSAQEDLLAAHRLAADLAHTRVAGARERSDGLVDAARERLRRWQIPEAEIRRIERSGVVFPATTVEAPSSGYVLEMGVREGGHFAAGDPLYRLADLSRVWIHLEVHERDLPHLAVGAPVRVELPGHPAGGVEGPVAYVYPEVDPTRRTIRVRIELPNPGGHLKPGMFGTARLRVRVAEGVITVPRDAVMHTGERSVIFVAVSGDRFEPREVRVGAEAGDRVEVVAGLEAGERVVARAGFILDSESRLMEAMRGQPAMPGMDMGGTAAPPGTDPAGDAGAPGAPDA